MSDVLFKDESYRIVGACFEVYKDKGCGFHEPIYQECLGLEFGLQNIPAIAKPRLELEYKGRRLEQTYEPDFLCFGKIVVELKALTHLGDEHSAQVMNYLKVTGFKLGLLVNFGHYPRLEYLRIVAADRWNSSGEAQPDLQT
jgi:GxxExxY protein